MHPITDAEDYDLPTAPAVPVKSDRWEGEDEEEPVKVCFFLYFIHMLPNLFVIARLTEFLRAVEVCDG